MCLKVIGEKHFALKFAASIVLKNVHFEMGNIGVVDKINKVVAN